MATTADDVVPIPVPDPTVLTTEALLREVRNLKDLLNLRIEGLQSVMSERDQRVEQQIMLNVEERNQALAGMRADWSNQHGALEREVRSSMEATTALRHTEIATVEQQVTHLRLTIDEKFRSVELQFKERDTRSERESRDNKVAVDAAFAAQKEAASEQNKSNTLAITKSEVATQETINKLAELFRTTTDALGDKIDDLKQRMADTERSLRNSISEADRKINGSDQRRVGGVDARAVALAIGSLIIAFIGIGIAAVSLATR